MMGLMFSVMGKGGEPFLHFLSGGIYIMNRFGKILNLMSIR